VIFTKVVKHGKTGTCQVWWYTPVISAIRRLRQKDWDFQAAWASKEGPVSNNKSVESYLS
jgi:hypothetical protein